MNVTTYCNLTNFSKSYEQLHGVLSLTLCVFGSVANVLMMTVLLRKDMRWPTNLILAGLAVADLLVMLEYIPFSLHRYFNEERRNYASSYNYNWAIFMFFHALFSQIFHFISCCLTVILAVWRYVTISKPHNTRAWFGLKKTFYVIVLVYLCAPIICSPIIFSLTIKHHNQTCDPTGKFIERSELKTYKGEITSESIYVTAIASETAKVISFWVYSVVIKLVPCVLLTHLSWKLVSILVETKKRKKVLLQTVVNLKDMKTSGLLSNKKKKVNQADRTSNMLLALLFLFLITEFPQAILGLLSAILEEFEKQCYRPLGEYDSNEILNGIYKQIIAPKIQYTKFQGNSYLYNR
ncbi:G-protein coupled receptor dmsr-1-like [Harmonia axyridis]|uniref:G-protein coupled receptor dmsr-1-like n=1 Tax=Harmonia axyridis TaxID=115357 RepID=UPI001E277582|nr:G-protein coupled receptor dmsr-1-like [Harmonia axyridis]